MNEKKKDIVVSWEKTGLLQGIEDPIIKEQLALIFENQMRSNKILMEETNLLESAKEYVSFFCKMSIPIIRRVFDSTSFLGFHIASIQSMSDSDDLFSYRDFYGNLRARMTSSKAAILQNKIVKPEKEDTEEERKLCSDYASWLRWKINKEIFNDIHTHASSFSEHQWKERDDLEAHIRMMMGRVEKKSGRAPNWILTTPKLSSLLLGQDLTKDNIVHKGNLGNKKVFSYPDCSEGCVLIGYKGDHYASGYFYCPFIPLILTDVQEHKLASRYGKTMPFPELYGKIQVMGY